MTAVVVLLYHMGRDESRPYRTWFIILFLGDLYRMGYYFHAFGWTGPSAANGDTIVKDQCAIAQDKTNTEAFVYFGRLKDEGIQVAQTRYPCAVIPDFVITYDSELAVFCDDDVKDHRHGHAVVCKVY